MSRRVAAMGRIVRRAARLGLLACVAAGPAISFASQSADDADQQPALLEDGGFLELGIYSYVNSTIKASDDEDEDEDAISLEAGVGLGLAGSWRRGRYFVEGTGFGLEGLSIGATLWHDRIRTLDLLVAHLPSSIDLAYSSDADSIDGPSTESERSGALLERNTLLGTSGLRFREYRGDWLGEFSAVVDWSNGNGVLANARLGRQWQLGNWNLTAIAGLGYVSAELVDFLYGVDEDEATQRFAAYEVDDTVFGEANATVSRAIGENLVFRTSFSGWLVDDEITDSPLIARSTEIGVITSLNYVF